MTKGQDILELLPFLYKTASENGITKEELLEQLQQQQLENKLNDTSVDNDLIEDSEEYDANLERGIETEVMDKAFPELEVERAIDTLREKKATYLDKLRAYVL